MLITRHRLSSHGKRRLSGLLPAALLVLAVTAACATESERRGNANNLRFVAEFERTATGCAAVANDQQTAAPVAAGSGTSGEAARAQHERSYQYAAAVLCLLNQVDRMLPLPPPLTSNPGLLASASPADLTTHLTCVDDYTPAWVPAEQVADLSAARQWWTATVDRLATATPVALDAAADVWTGLNTGSRIPVTDDAYPVYSGTGKTGAWLTFDPTNRKFTVTAPTEQDVRDYCGSLFD